jgi:serine/threonine-protein kinase
MGSYEIGDLLGAGGMGAVYRAHDTRLKRDVAIKVLSDAVTHDRERLARFEREARLLAALNHPHIAGIHGIDEADGQQFLVMELVEGETLSDRVAAGPIPVGEALAIARQIAEALEAAHEKGIVHRDLKPSNVQVGRDGRVKLLDFGLAKALDPDPSGSGVDSLSRSPTISHQMTGVGVILGTAAYMSPEQVRGRPVDRRSDIWAFGIVLFEMLTGRRLFTGETVSDTLASVLKSDPDWSLLPAETPPTIRRLLARCLERNPKERLHDAGDARLEIDEAIAERRSGTSSQISGIPVVEPARSWRPLTLLPLVVAVVVGAGIGFLAGRRAAPTANPATATIRSVIPLAPGVRLAGWASPVVALSRDGRSLAYVAAKEDDPIPRLWVRNMESGETRLVPDSDLAEGPFFSPDGAWVAFAVDVSAGVGRPGQMRKFSLATGLTQLVAPIPDYFGGDWGDDGTILFAAHSTKGPWTLPAAGGQPDTSTESVMVGGKKQERALGWPQRLAGGRQALFTDGNASGWGNAALLDLTTRELHDLQLVAPFARYLPTGHLLTVQPDGVLLATPFDIVARQAKGPSVAVLKEVAFGCNAAGVLAVSDSGSLVYATGYLRGSGRELKKLARLTLSGEVQPLPFEPDVFGRFARHSPDGQKIAVPTWDGSRWIYDLARGSRSRLPHGKAAPSASTGDFMVWAPDGERIVFSTYLLGHPGESIVRQKADGSEDVEVLIAGGAEKSAFGFTPDGRTLVFRQYGSPDEQGLWMLPVAEKALPRRLVAGRIVDAALSPDGRWIAYTETSAGTSEIFVQRFPGLGEKVHVSVGEAGGPQWSTDGGSIYYRSAAGFFRVRLTAGERLEVRPPEKMFEPPPGVLSYSVASDGKGFVSLIRQAESGIVRELNLVTNWFDELERVAPSGIRK